MCVRRSAFERGRARLPIDLKVFATDLRLSDSYSVQGRCTRRAASMVQVRRACELSWSAPRLPGRGEQRNIVMHTLFLSALYWMPGDHKLGCAISAATP